MKYVVLLGLFLISINGVAQSYKLKVNLQNGETVEYPLSEVSSIAIEEIEENNGDVDNGEEGISAEQMEKAREILSGDMVLSSKWTMAGVDKTLLPEGCPMKFKFQWDSENSHKFRVSANDVRIGGNMPFDINFKCDVTCMLLNSWEKQEYLGDGWIKFRGNNGSVWSTSEDADIGSDESSLEGYYNVDTHQILLIINWNWMNVRTEVFMQTIDKDRINHFDEEYAQYEKDLEEYKKEHGYM